MPDTSTPLKAQEHARAMHGTRIETMPTLPPEDAVDLPADTAIDRLVWDETIAPGGYASHYLQRGTRLRLINTRGDACVSALIYNADQTAERLNIADTVKVQWNGYLGAGKLLLSDMGRVLMSITADTCGRHDTFAGPSTAASNAKRYGVGDNFTSFPNARDRFRIALTKLGMGSKDIAPCVNFFKRVRIEPDGRMRFDASTRPPGEHIELRAEMHVLVVLVNCPHVLDPREHYNVTPVRAIAWSGPATPKNDAIRNATPEGLRAYLNVEDYYRR